MADGQPLRRAQPGLGTLIEVSVTAPDRATALRASTAAFEAVALVHRLMSFHATDSDLGRINHAPAGSRIDVHPHTADVLACALDLHAASQGAFDCAIGHHLVAQGLLPADTGLGLGAADPAFVLDDGVVHKLTPTLLDLGGIAKGYAVDLAMAAAQAAGAKSVLVNAGGDMRHMGSEPVEIWLRDPRDASRACARHLLHNRALASSRSGGLAQRPGAPSALIDARRGTALPHGRSASIEAPNCILADALTKVVLVSGWADHPLLARHDAQVVLHTLH